MFAISFLQVFVAWRSRGRLRHWQTWKWSHASAAQSLEFCTLTRLLSFIKCAVVRFIVDSQSNWMPALRCVAVLQVALTEMMTTLLSKLVDIFYRVCALPATTTVSEGEFAHPPPVRVHYELAADCCV